MISHSDPSIAGWDEAGETAVVHDVEAFSRDVLPRYFRHSKWTSFNRQLNLYQFNTQKISNKRKEFSSPYFRRGCPELLSKIRRRTPSLSIAPGHRYRINSAKCNGGGHDESDDHRQKQHHCMEQGIQHESRVLVSPSCHIENAERCEVSIEQTLRSSHSIFGITGRQDEIKPTEYHQRNHCRLFPFQEMHHRRCTLAMLRYSERSGSGSSYRLLMLSVVATYFLFEERQQIIS
jgi:HSF-type DNA-binding